MLKRQVIVDVKILPVVNPALLKRKTGNFHADYAEAYNAYRIMAQFEWLAITFSTDSDAQQFVNAFKTWLEKNAPKLTLTLPKQVTRRERIVYIQKGQRLATSQSYP